MSKSRFIIWLLLWIISTLALADETNQANAILPSYTLVGNENYPPLIYKQNNTARGLIVDLAEAVAEKGGFEARVLAMEWASAQKKVQDGELDALLLINKNPQREQLYDFSTPLFESEFVIFKLKNRTDIALPASLHGKSVGVEKGGYTTSLMEKYPGIQKITIADLHEGFKLLSQGKIDALVTERWAGEFDLTETGIAGIVVVPNPIETSTSYIAVRKGNTTLLQKINAGLAEMELDGTRHKIFENWKGREIIYITKDRFIYYQAAAVLVFVGFGLCLIIYIYARQLANTREKYRDLFDNANDLLYTTDLNGIITSANYEMLKVLDYTKDELVGQPISKILAEDALEIKINKMAAKISGEVAHTIFRVEILAKDGHSVPVEFNSRLIYESGKPAGIQGIARDISVQLRREAELRAANQKVEEATRVKSHFLAAAGHDLRQPLASANLFIGTLKFTKPSSSQSEIIERLEEAMSNFDGLLNALLNISKLESGVIEPEFNPVAVADIAQWLKQSFAPMAEESGLGLRLRFPIENLVVLSDFNLIKQVLANLVSNAIKYTPKGAILVSARRRGTDVLFQVWDTGIGIEVDQFEHIFEGFYQINNPQGDSENGLGLGLVIVKRSLALLGVEVTYRSQFGRGSVFGFSLPLDDPGQTHQPVSTPAHDGMETAIFARGKRFVVLENDRLVAQGISSLLEAMGGEVKLFDSAEDALCCADTEKADYYICDYKLDGALNGLQFLNQLHQKLGTPLNAILLSGDTSPAFVKEIKNCAWPVLSKPVNVSRLISSLNDALI